MSNVLSRLLLKASGVAVRPLQLIVGSGLSLVDNRNGTATLAAAGGSSLEVKEGDGAPDVSGVTSITVSNGTLTDNGGGSVTLTTGGGGGGTGTVTSVAATVPTGFSVGGTPVTTTGTLAVTLDAQSGNKVLSSPADGSSGTPAFRALVALDIPAIAESGVTSLTTDLGLKAPIANPTFTGITTAPEFSASGLTGATAASRYVGATASGAPVSGTFVLGDWVVDQTGKRWTCTVGGSPGTWVQEPGTGGGVPAAFDGARYNTASTQAISSGTLTIIDYGTVVYDPNARVTTGASWHFTVGTTGYYHINAGIIFQGASEPTATALDFFVFVNGTQTVEIARTAGNGGVSNFAAFGGATLHLTAGDTVDIRAYQSTSESISLFSAADRNYVNIERVG